MLRFSYSDTAGGQRWNLCGRLAGPWVEELRSFWQQVRQRTPRARALVDLKDVTFIDKAGEVLLAEMDGAGAEFVAAGVENKHLLTTLKDKRNGAVQREVEHLGAALADPATPHGGNK
jgi:hypothetical protein